MIRTRFLPSFFLAFLMSVPTSTSAIANDAAVGHKHSLTVDQAISWLPPNTETIIVVQEPFVIGPIKADSEFEVSSSEKMLQSVACGPFGSEEHLKCLNGLTVAFVVEGARGFRPPKDIGGFLYTGCHIIVFKDDLKTFKNDFVKALETENPKEEEIAGQKTFVLEKEVRKDKLKFYFTMPLPNVILAATDRQYLEEVLRRMARALAAIARLADVPEQTVEFMRDRLRPVSSPSSEDLGRLIAELNSSQFARRESATNELTELGELAEAALGPEQSTTARSPAAN